MIRNIYENIDFLSFEGNKALAKALGHRWYGELKKWADGRPTPEDIDVIDGFGVIKDVDNGVEWLAVDYDNRLIAKENKFSWDAQSKKWVRPLVKKACDIADVSFSDCSGYEEVSQEQLAASGITTDLYDFQLSAVGKMVASRRCYNGSDMGNGKTIMALSAALLLKKGRILIMCPASLKQNWKHEIIRHTVFTEKDVFILDSKNISKLADEKFVIINYDILDKLSPELTRLVNAVEWSIIADEFHFCKNSKAKRTSAALSLIERVETFFALSGTPITKNAGDFYTAYEALRIKAGFKNEFSFKSTFCHEIKRNIGRKTITQYIGMKEPKRFRSMIFGNYLRFEAKEVALPDYRFQRHYVVASEASIKKLQKAIKEIAENSKDLELKMKAQFDSAGQNDIAFGSLKKLLAETKIKNTVEFVKELLEDEDQSVVIYSDHVASAEKIAEYFCTEAIVGGVSLSKRDQLVQDFQAKKCRVLVGTSAIATGLTLTAANILVVNDASWNVATDDQLSKRIHRIGQEQACTRFDMTLDDDRLYDIDNHIAELLRNKRQTMDKMKG